MAAVITGLAVAGGGAFSELLTACGAGAAPGGGMVIAGTAQAAATAAIR